MLIQLAPQQLFSTLLTEQWRPVLLVNCPNALAFVCTCKKNFGGNKKKKQLKIFVFSFGRLNVYCNFLLEIRKPFDALLPRERSAFLLVEATFGLAP